MPKTSKTKNKIQPQKNGGEPPLTPQIVIPGWTAGGVLALWVSEHHPPRRKHIKFSVSAVSAFLGWILKNVYNILNHNNDFPYLIF